MCVLQDYNNCTTFYPKIFLEKFNVVVPKRFSFKYQFFSRIESFKAIYEINMTMYHVKHAEGWTRLLCKYGCNLKQHQWHVWGWIYHTIFLAKYQFDFVMSFNKHHVMKNNGFSYNYILAGNVKSCNVLPGIILFQFNIVFIQCPSTRKVNQKHVQVIMFELNVLLKLIKLIMINIWWQNRIS